MPGEPHDVRVVGLPGQLGGDAAAGVFAALALGLSRGTVVIGDLSGTRCCTRQGAMVLLHARAAAAAAGAQLRLAAAGPGVREVLARAAGQVLPVYPSVQAARAGAAAASAGISHEGLAGTGSWAGG